MNFLSEITGSFAHVRKTVAGGGAYGTTASTGHIIAGRPQDLGDAVRARHGWAGSALAAAQVAVIPFLDAWAIRRHHRRSTAWSDARKLIGENTDGRLLQSLCEQIDPAENRRDVRHGGGTSDRRGNAQPARSPSSSSTRQRLLAVLNEKRRPRRNSCLGSTTARSHAGRTSWLTRPRWLFRYRHSWLRILTATPRTLVADD